MHLYARSVGLSEITSKNTMDHMLNTFVDEAIKNNRVRYNVDNDSVDGFYEAQIDREMMSYSNVAGLTIRGIFNPEIAVFEPAFYFPYIKGNTPRFNTELFIERQTDKEAYMVHCNEPRREVAPIFFMNNIVEFLDNEKGKKYLTDRFVYLSGLSVEGKIILPIMQTKEQIDKCKAATNKRNQLVDMALQGNPDAIDNLTMDDYDMLTNLCQRIKTEDIYSIVNTSFIPSGLECDNYSVVGNILEVECLKNMITGEEVYYMLLECNDNMINVAINKKDLYGLPQKGYRFVGKIWLQGAIDFSGNSGVIDAKSDS